MDVCVSHLYSQSKSIYHDIIYAPLHERWFLLLNKEEKEKEKEKEENKVNQWFCIIIFLSSFILFFHLSYFL